jgi:hypothetical protein
MNRVHVLPGEQTTSTTSPNGRLIAGGRTQARLSENRLVDTLVRLGLLVMIGVTAASAILIGVAHVSDRYNVNHVSGTWMALADDARHGTLYRPLFDHGFFGGTWYTPLEFVLQAGVSFVTGEYVVSGKLLAYATALAMLALIYVLLRRVGCSRLISAALASSVLLAPAGLFAATAIRGDTLPLVLQLAAVGLLSWSVSRRTLMVAAALCGLALAAKLSAVWAPFAIIVWLALGDRRRLRIFLPAFAGALLVTFGVFEAASSGRMTQTLFAVSGSGNSGASPLAGVPRLFDFIVRDTGPTWLLLPFALLAIAISVTERRLSLYQLSFLISLPLLAIVLADPGSDFNHLIDLVVLTVVVVGELWARAGSRNDMSGIALVIALALLLGGADSYRQSLKSDTRGAVDKLLGRETASYPTHPLAGYVSRTDRILSEDPAIPLLLNERPLLVDAVSVRRVGLEHPEWIAALRDRIARDEFDKVVLVHPIEDNDWYQNKNFGRPIQDAIEKHYSLVARVPRQPLVYWVYAPRSA